MDNSRGLAGARVLIVDDEPDQVEMYQYALEEAGFRVLAAFTGDNGIARARDAAPDVIVLDLRLPDMSGWDVCRALKSDPVTEQIPVVILTAAASPTLGQQAAAAGCVAHLLKPCYPEELTKTIRGILAAT
jgi:two-component system phosphate regulon response regulator PhoB